MPSFAEPARALSFLPDAEALFFLYGIGCEACAAAEPELDKFAARSGLFILRLDASREQAKRVMKHVTATPTYVFRRGGSQVAHVGALKEKELSRWIDRARKALTEG